MLVTIAETIYGELEMPAVMPGSGAATFTLSRRYFCFLCTPYPQHLPFLQLKFSPGQSSSPSLGMLVVPCKWSSNWYHSAGGMGSCGCSRGIEISSLFGVAIVGLLSVRS